MADWVANSIYATDTEKDTSIVELEKYIYSHAKDFGLADFVDEEMNPTCELEEHSEIQDRIDAYNEENFCRNYSTSL